MPVRRRRATVRRNSSSHVSAAYSAVMHSLDEIERRIGHVAEAAFVLASAGGAQRFSAALIQKVHQLDEVNKATRSAAARLGGDLFD